MGEPARLARLFGVYLAACAVLTVLDLATGGAFHAAVLNAITFTAGMVTGVAVWRQ
jgi:hypothetical protein